MPRKQSADVQQWTLYRRYGKRWLDLALGISALIVLSPLLGLIALLVRLKLGAPILFRQTRPGLRGQLFTLLKFRSMTDAADAEGNLLPEEHRLGAFGRFLRSRSLDELPQLFNVLNGDLSLVGPRPLRIKYLSRYSPAQARRHEVKPGITGWAQVNGRNALTWEEKFRLDVWYVDHWNLRLDLRILWLTAVQVFKRDGISAEGHATMPEFKGSQETLEG